MSFKAKSDPFGLASANLKCVSTAESKSAQVVEATDQYGTIKASEVFGETMAPTAEYRLSGDYTFSVPLGSVSTWEDKQIALGSITINTGAGTPPTFSASGEQIEDGGTANCEYALSGEVEKCHHAQVLFDAFTLSGSGCYLQTANYNATATITKATKEGVCIAHDVVGGRIEATIDVKQTGSTEPSITAGSGWQVTSPLNCTNPDADYPTYSATLVKYLDRSTAL